MPHHQNGMIEGLLNRILRSRVQALLPKGYLGCEKGPAILTLLRTFVFAHTARSFLPQIRVVKVSRTGKLLRRVCKMHENAIAMAMATCRETKIGTYIAGPFRKISQVGMGFEGSGLLLTFDLAGIPRDCNGQWRNKNSDCSL